MSINLHNGETFSAGDILVLSSNGGIFRQQLTPPSSGSSGGGYITYRSLNGAKIAGSDLVTGWANYSGNVWRASLADNPETVYFDGELGTEVGSTGAVTEAGEWYWGSDYLYTYSTSDPDTAFTDPGVETAARSYGVWLNGLDYIKLEDFEVYHALSDGVLVQNSGSVVSQYIVCEDLYVHDISLPATSSRFGIRFNNVSYGTIRRCRVDNVGWNAISVGCLWNGGRTLTDELIEYCTINNPNGHGGIDIHAVDGGSYMSDVTIRYNRIVASGQNGIYCMNEGSDTDSTDTVYVYGNVVSNCQRVGIAFDITGDGEYFTDCVIVNNTIYNTGTDAVNGWGPSIDADCRGAIIKNNICVDGNINSPWYAACIAVADGGGTPNVVDYNLCYRSDAETLLYIEDGTERTHAQYVSFGQQANAPTPADPLFTDADNGDFTLQAGSPAIGAGDDTIGATYKDMILPGSSWPDSVTLGDQDDY